MTTAFFGVKSEPNPNSKTKWKRLTNHKLFNLNRRIQKSKTRLETLRDDLMRSYENGMDASDLETDYELELLVYEGVCWDAGQDPCQFPSVAQLVRFAVG